MYTFTETGKHAVDEFAVANGIFQQTSYWADFRRIFKPTAFIGSDGQKTVLSCLMLRLAVPCTPYSIGYITRGFVCDYKNTQLVREFTEYLKAYMRKKHVVYAIFDPMCDYKVDFEISQPDINELFLSLGYVKNTGVCMQPQTNYRVLYDVNNDIDSERRRIFDAFAPRLRNDIAISHDRGVICERASGRDLDRAVEIFYNLLLETTKKKGFGHRSLDYYRRFALSLKDFVTIYLYKYDSAKDIAYTEDIIKSCTEHLARIDAELADPATTDKKKERLAPKRKEVVKQLTATEARLKVAQSLRHDPYISASFYIRMGDKAYNFYGANAAALRDLRLTANYWDMMYDSVDGTVSSFNMGGTLKLNSDDIKHDKTYDLYQYKRQYTGQLVQFPGEYFLINNRRLFELLHNKLNYFRRIVFRF